MTAEFWISSMTAGIAAIMALFFGQAYWKMLQSLINGLRADCAALQRRLDLVELKLSQKDDELSEMGKTLDSYVSLCQQLKNHIGNLEAQIAEMTSKLPTQP